MVKMIATALGVGYCPVAPGTAGTVAAIPLYLVLSPYPWPLYLVTLLATTAWAAWVSAFGERIFARKDAPQIVIDEVVGFLWTMFALQPTVTTVLMGFLLFRLFDIVKPYPVRLLQERLPGGWGVVMDDVGAGIYANLCLQVITVLGMDR
ncbi:MAG: phosphatidylglycerophosphatase A [Syntrophales bacterium]|nr:phosphatidylglycerophosphatase A [Syntrophales bacterium]